MPYALKKRTLRRESAAGKPARLTAARRALDGGARIAAIVTTQYTKGKDTQDEDRKINDRNMGNNELVLACAIQAAIRQSPLGTELRPVDPPAPILTNSDHTSNDATLSSQKSTSLGFSAFFRGWQKCDACQAAKASYAIGGGKRPTKFSKCHFWVILAKTPYRSEEKIALTPTKLQAVPRLITV